MDYNHSDVDVDTQVEGLVRQKNQNQTQLLRRSMNSKPKIKSQSREKPSRHHSYNGHASSMDKVRVLSKSKSNNQIDTGVLGLESKSLKSNLPEEEIKEFETANENVENTRKQLVLDLKMDGIAPSNNKRSFNYLRLDNHNEDEEGEGNELLVASGLEETKNRYNALVSQLTAIDSNSESFDVTSPTQQQMPMMTVIGSFNNINGVEGKGNYNGFGNNPNNSPTTETNGLNLTPCDFNNSTVKISRNPSVNSLAVEINNKQSLKHLSASAPAMRTELGKTPDKGDFFMAPSSSKSRQKKFHRHFKTVPPEEKVLDYYSCALVGDILLQGFLYISENYFAFYSNVFGYVTKLLIPVCTVVSITKEKTAKIFPNAVGIQTQSEKHVFASLISRDTTYKLMYKVWIHSTQQLPSDAIILQDSEKGFDDTSGDIAIPDESSGESGSGNDSAMEPSSCSPSPQSTPGIEKLIHHHHLLHHEKLMIPTNNNNNVIAHLSHSHPAQMEDANALHTRNDLLRGVDPMGTISNGSILSQAYLRHPHRTSVSASNEAHSRSFPRNDAKGKPRNVDPSEVGGSTKTPSLLILATAILVILFLSAALLLVRISNLQQKLMERPGIPTTEQVYEELLTWQNRQHSNSADEIYQFIDTNLQQIVRVRESLELLSTLFVNGRHNSVIGEHTSSSHSHFANRDG